MLDTYYHQDPRRFWLQQEGLSAAEQKQIWTLFPPVVLQRLVLLRGFA